MNKILIILLLFNLKLISQPIKKVFLYKLKNNLEETNTIKKELEIMKIYYGAENNSFSICFKRLRTCKDTLFVVSIEPSFTIIDTSKIFGIVIYKNLKIYIQSDSLFFCKFNLLLEKIKDTIITLDEFKQKNLDFEKEVTFDGEPKKILAWDNFFIFDKLNFILPYYEIYYELDTIAIKSDVFHKLVNYKKQCYLDLVKLKLDKKIDNIQYIYFSYHKRNDTIFNYEIFYPINFNKELILINKFIVKKLKKQKKLNDGYYYIGEAILVDKKLFLNYTYLSNCKQ